jgi:hypothetical protein
MQISVYRASLPASRQVQIVTDTVRGCGSRLAGLEIQPYAHRAVVLERLRGDVAYPGLLSLSTRERLNRRWRGWDR